MHISLCSLGKFCFSSFPVSLKHVLTPSECSRELCFVPVHGRGSRDIPALPCHSSVRLKECIPGSGTGLAGWGARESKGNTQYMIGMTLRCLF